MRAILRGEEQAQRRLAMADRFLRKRKALDIAGEMVLEAAYDAFAAASDPETGAPWPALRPSTVAGRRKGGRGARPLLDTGLLRGSLQRGGRSGIWRYRGAEALQVGTAVKTGIWHQEGTRPYTIRPVRKRWLRFRGPDGQWVFAKVVRHPGLRRRRFLGVSQTMAARISTVMAAELERDISHGG